MPTEKLTPRQEDVLYALASGLSKRQTATALFLSYETVRSHAKAARRKLGASNDAHMITLASKAGLLDRIGLGRQGGLGNEPW